MVTFINTNGMAFFGPGSEWFWAALQFTALLVTFIAIYRQLRIGRSQRAVEQVALYTRQLEDERMCRHQLAILVALRDGASIPRAAGNAISNYFETLGSLGRSGHLDMQQLWGLFSLTAEGWWTILQPYTREARAELGDTVGENFEWLVGAFERMDRRGKTTPALDAIVARWLVGGAIERLEDNIRVEQELRAVIIASPHGRDAAQVAAAASAQTPSPTAQNEQSPQAD
ncbi:MAG: hypothetical protein WB808_02095 [Candidatus Dormiibacterota bacterium]